MNIENLLAEEITEEFEKLSKMDTGSEAYKVTVDGLTKLVDRSIELKKIDLEQQEKGDTREIEIVFKREQMEEDKKDRKINYGIAIGGIVLPLTVTIWGALKSWKFEETGTVTTTMGRGFMNKLLPKK